MTATPRALLLPELVHAIARHTDRADLSSLALVSKSFNANLTPLLYRSIIVYRYDLLWKLIQTLRTAPEQLSFGRDLAIFVLDLELYKRFEATIYVMKKTDLVRNLAQTVPRLRNLQLFRYAMMLPLEITLLHAFATTHLPRLLHLELEPYGYCDMREREPCLSYEEAISPDLPSLTSYTFYFDYALSPQQNTIHRAILSSCATFLTKLALYGAPAQLLVSLPMFTALEALDIDAVALSLPFFQHTSNIRSLSIRGDYLDPSRIYTLNIGPESFPKLEELACLTSMIYAFLPPNGRPRRPVRTVRIGYVRYFKEWGPSPGPTWSNSVEAISFLAFSAIPVTTLEMYWDFPGPDELKRIPLVLSLETFIIVTDKIPSQIEIEQLAPIVLAHLPRLHTFHLLESSYMRKNFEHAEDLAFQARVAAEYATYRPTLRRVAFTNAVEWTIGEEGSWKHSDLLDRRKLECERRVPRSRSYNELQLFQ